MQIGKQDGGMDLLVYFKIVNNVVSIKTRHLVTPVRKAQWFSSLSFRLVSKLPVKKGALKLYRTLQRMEQGWNSPLPQVSYTWQKTRPNPAMPSQAEHPVNKNMSKMQYK
jgi:hypothetical protein